MASAIEHGGLRERNPLNRRTTEWRRRLLARKSVVNFLDAIYAHEKWQMLKNCLLSILVQPMKLPFFCSAYWEH